MTDKPAFEYRAKLSANAPWTDWLPAATTDEGYASFYSSAEGSVHYQTRPYVERWKPGWYQHDRNAHVFECRYVDDDGNGYGLMTVELPSGPSTYPDGVDAYSLKDWHATTENGEEL